MLTLGLLRCALPVSGQNSQLEENNCTVHLLTRSVPLHDYTQQASVLGRTHSHVFISSEATTLPMQTATAFLAPPPLPTQAHGDPLRSSVGQLLKKAYALPCSTAAQAFAQLVQPTARFQLALDALLPLLDSPRTEVSTFNLRHILSHTCH